MPFDAAPLALIPRDLAYVEELFLTLKPGAEDARSQYIFLRTRHEWQVQMSFVVLGTAQDPAMPTYEKGYVIDLYNQLLPYATTAYVSYILDRTPAALQDNMKARTSSQLFADAVVRGGGTVSPARLAIITNFINAERASGAWQQTDDYWCFWAENQIQAQTSLKQRLLGTVSGAPVFTPDRHFAFSGTNFLNTLFVPRTHGTMTVDDVHMTVYERVNITSNTVAFGASFGGNLNISGCRVSAAQAFLLAGAAGFTTATSLGYTSSGRTGTSARGWRNGVEITPAVTVAPGGGVTQVALYFGGLNNNGTLLTGRACSVGFGAVGRNLTPAQELAHYQAVQAWATAVGANV